MYKNADRKYRNSAGKKCVQKKWVREQIQALKNTSMYKTKFEIFQNHKKYAKKQTLKKKTYYEIHTLNYQSLIVIR